MSVLKSSGDSATKVNLTYYYTLYFHMLFFFLSDPFLCVRPVAEVRPLKIITGLKRRQVGRLGQVAHCTPAHLVITNNIREEWF